MANAGSSRRTVAVILAGGSGSRVGLNVPKQLLKIAGKSILEHTVTLFDDAAEIDDIVILMTPGFVEDAQKIVDAAGFTKVRPVLAGGSTRSETTSIALRALAEGGDDSKVLFHDAVRPLLEPRIITDCVVALDTFDAVDVAIPSADTIIAVEDDCISEIPDRGRLRRGQTPQAFRFSTIRRAYELAADDPDFTATDDCGVVLRYLPEVPIHVVAGSEQNMKVTHPIDLFVADKLFQVGSKEAPAASDTAEYTRQFTGRTVVVLGGSYGIGADIATLCRGFGADVFSFSRSETGTHVERPDDIEAALKTAFDATGRIDHVVLTAGVLHRGELAETDAAVIAESIEVNFVAPVTVARLSLPYLARTQGELLLFTSSSYTRGRAGYSIYSSTKAAVVNLTQALAEEWAPLGVRVNCLNPERTGTPMRTAAFGAEPADSLLSSRAVALTAADVLLSDLTGHVVDVRRLEPGNMGRSRTGGEADLIATALEAVESAAEAEAEAAADLAHGGPSAP